MKKTKLLYDIEQLLTTPSGKETGICRVALEVLKRIAKQKQYEVYPIVTTLKGVSPEEWCKKNGLAHLIPNIVKMPYLKRTTHYYNLYKNLRCWLYERKYASRYIPILNRFDEYISVFSPISPLVYKSRVKTKLIIHDMIPFVLPQTCTPSFINKFRSWIKRVKADEVFCDSKSTRADFLKCRPDYKNKKTKVVYLAADAKFKPTKSNTIREQYHIPTQKYFLAVSQHAYNKNFMYIVDAFIEFLKATKAEDVSLVLTGPTGQTYNRLQEKVCGYPEFADKITCTGFVADKDMPALYSQATAFLYPSLYEGFGLPILEAMQCGTPVITCNNSSLPEVGGNAAIYVSETDAKDMAKAMKNLYHNPQKQQELSRKGIQRAKRFTWDSTVQQLFDLH